MTEDEIIKRLSIFNTAKDNLSKISLLIEFIDDYYGKLSKETEERLKEYKDARQKLRGVHI